MKKIIIMIIATITLTGISNYCYAVIPVIDPTEILKTVDLINKTTEQVKEIKKISDINKDQLDFLKTNINGNYGYGKLFNGTDDLNSRQWSNNSWVDVLNEVSDHKTSAFADAQKKYEQLYPVSNPEEIGKYRKDGGLVRAYYKQSSQISRAALASSSYSYDQINKHIENLHAILAKLDDQTTEKAAIDLNARLVAELGFIQLEMLRQQSIQNQLTATNTQGEVNGLSDQARFMQWKP